MATITFLGRDDDWENPDNWDGHALPVDADDVIVPRTARSSLIRHVDRRGDSGGVGLALNSFIVHRGYRGDIGGEGAPFCASVNNATVTLPSIICRGTGSVHFADIGLPVASKILVNSPNQRNALQLMSTTGHSAIGALTVVNGHAHAVGDFGVIDTLLVATRPAPSTPVQSVARVSLSNNAAVLYGYMGSGEVECKGTCTSLTMCGGTWRQGDKAITVNVVGGGRFILNSTTVQNTVYLMGGVYDTTESDEPKTITSLYKFPSATLKKSDGLTIANAFDVFDESWTG